MRRTTLKYAQADRPVNTVVRAVIVEVAGVVVETTLTVIVVGTKVVVSVNVVVGVSVTTVGKTHAPDSEL